jgi:hypothetical protein
MVRKVPSSCTSLGITLVAPLAMTLPNIILSGFWGWRGGLQLLQRYYDMGGNYYRINIISALPHAPPCRLRLRTIHRN